MFTGIIESVGKVKAITPEGQNLKFTISSTISGSLHVDESVSHNGVCLTVVNIQDGSHQVVAIEETLQKSALGKLKAGDFVNLERAMLPASRLDGHIVQGHVDTTATCEHIITKDGSHIMEFRFPEKFASLIIEKGSIAIEGISLTIFDITHNSFKVAIIPYTFEHTNLKYKKPGEEVNIEFDMVGKYINRIAYLKNELNG